MGAVGDIVTVRACRPPSAGRRGAPASRARSTRPGRPYRVGCRTHGGQLGLGFGWARASLRGSPWVSPPRPRRRCASGSPVSSIQGSSTLVFPACRFSPARVKAAFPRHHIGSDRCVPSARPLVPPDERHCLMAGRPREPRAPYPEGPRTPGRRPNPKRAREEAPDPLPSRGSLRPQLHSSLDSR